MPASKYAQIERERRFLVREVPRAEPLIRRAITDLYLDGTRIRLRQSVGIVDGQDEVLRKLTQKLPDVVPVGGRRGTITTMYLDEAEYQRLSSLPGRWLTKERLSFPPLCVDVIQGPLAGLIIAEVEFSDDEEMLQFVAPPWCRAEITEYDGIGPCLNDLIRSNSRSSTRSRFTDRSVELVDVDERTRLLRCPETLASRNETAALCPK